MLHLFPSLQIPPLVHILNPEEIRQRISVTTPAYISHSLTCLCQIPQEPVMLVPSSRYYSPHGESPSQQLGCKAPRLHEFTFACQAQPPPQVLTQGIKHSVLHRQSAQHMLHIY